MSGSWNVSGIFFDRSKFSKWSYLACKVMVCRSSQCKPLCRRMPQIDEQEATREIRSFAKKT